MTARRSPLTEHLLTFWYQVQLHAYIVPGIRYITRAYQVVVYTYHTRYRIPGKWTYCVFGACKNRTSTNDGHTQSNRASYHTVAKQEMQPRFDTRLGGASQVAIQKRQTTCATLSYTSAVFVTSCYAKVRRSKGCQLIMIVCFRTYVRTYPLQ